MALVRCPECGKEISDKAKSCVGCGFPIQNYLTETDNDDNYENFGYSICPKCGSRNEIGVFSCDKCGYKYLLSDYKVHYSKCDNKNEFNGIYRSTVFGGLIEVYCPRCGSNNCSHYKEQRIIPEKTKTTYSVNFNPFKPFTIINKNEKVKRKEQIITENKFTCNDCGKIFY